MSPGLAGVVASATRPMSPWTSKPGGEPSGDHVLPLSCDTYRPFVAPPPRYPTAATSSPGLYVHATDVTNDWNSAGSPGTSTGVQVLPALADR